ncbi:hypothetical protein OIU74_026186 [Salix koriyanagi]|uniref:Uncharacterized protein n=1 Tax=Salix koriyanagi TaxID=2511006 RepID=A0A9Q1A3F7_9ROSI|nr:hypothetical protein OIU74_026186 [Salix koriyanagi]
MDSPRDSDYDGSSVYNSDSSSHYGSPVLAASELKACFPSPASSAPAAAEGPSEIPAVPPLAAKDSGPVLQVGLVPAQGLPPSDQAAAHAGNDVLVSEKAASLELSSGLVASLDVVSQQDPMAFEASTFVLARQPMLISRIRQPDPMVDTTSAGDWQSVSKKHTSNRQSKSGSGFLAPGKAGATSKRKMVEAVRDESVDNGLMVSNSLAAGSSKAEAVGNAPGGNVLKDLEMGCAELLRSVLLVGCRT